MISYTDKKIVNEIENIIIKNNNYFSYEHITKKDEIHGFAPYPATMVPQMQNDIISIICKHKDIKKIFDPFMGSGTVIVEAIKRNIEVYGTDINPYSYLLTSSKVKKIKIEDLKKHFIMIQKDILAVEYNYELHEFNNINKWFKSDIINLLSKIRYRLLKIQDEDIKIFFLISFSKVVTICKNSQSNTFKLHIKKDEDIKKFDKNPIDLFVKHTKNNISNYEIYYNKFFNKSFDSISHIYCTDVNNIRNNNLVEDRSIDLVMTSPPYGDNKTTVTYGQFSTLPLFWMLDERAIEMFNKKFFENYSAIDSASLGGSIYSEDIIIKSNIHNMSKTLKRTYHNIINQREKQKARKVSSFIIDFNEALNNMIALLKKDGYLVMVVGNRRVNNNIIELSKITEELLENTCYKLIEFERKINGKKMANKLSCVNNETVESIGKEIILIFKKL